MVGFSPTGPWKRKSIVNNCKLSYPVQYSCCCCRLVVSHLTLPAAWWDWLQLLCWVYCQRTAQGSESSACKNKQRTHLQSLLWKLYTRATYFKVDFWYITICLLTCSLIAKIIESGQSHKFSYYSIWKEFEKEINKVTVLQRRKMYK